MVDVSVLITTHKHEKFIAACIEGALMQKVNFTFEILVGVDHVEGNGTLEICRQFELRNPAVVRVVLNNPENVLLVNGSRVGRFNFLNILKEAKGKYIARCDGDDFWTDPNKLQKQFELLEKKPALSMCFHDFVIINSDGSPFMTLNKMQPVKNRDRAPVELVQGGSAIHLSTIMFRNVFERIPEQFHKVRNGDTFLIAYLTNWGGAGYLPGISPSKYRKHEGGSWSTQNFLQKHLDVVETLKGIKEVVDLRYHEVINYRIFRVLLTLAKFEFKRYYWFNSAKFTFQSLLWLVKFKTFFRPPNY